MSKIYVRLTESELHNLVREKATQIIKEIGDTPLGQYHLGRLYGRKVDQDNDDEASDVRGYAFNKRWEKNPMDMDDSEMQDAFDQGNEDQSAVERANRNMRDNATIWHNIYGKQNK